MAERGNNNQQRKDETASNNKRSANFSTFDLNVDDVPYVVEAESFTFNDEERYNIRVNGGTQHVYAWDSQVRRYRSLNDDASELPDTLDDAISRKLESGRL